MRNDPRSCERNLCNFVKNLKNECKKVARNTGSCQKVAEKLVESPNGRQHTTPALSRKGSIITFRGSPLHRHTTRRGPNHRMYAHEDFYGGKPIYLPPRGGGGGSLPYISHIGMWVCAASKGRVFAPFPSENGYTFWSGIAYGFQGNDGSIWTYLSFQFQMKNEKERVIREFEMNFTKSCLSSSLNSTYTRSENGSGK